VMMIVVIVSFDVKSGGRWKGRVGGRSESWWRCRERGSWLCI